MELENDMPNNFNMKAELNRPGTTDDINVDIKYNQRHSPKYQMTAEAKVSGIREMRLYKQVTEQVGNI